LLLHVGADGPVGGEEVADLVQEPVEGRLVGLQDVVFAFELDQPAAGNERVEFLGFAEPPDLIVLRMQDQRGNR
jgi:hypothetical protein